VITRQLGKYRRAITRCLRTRRRSPEFQAILSAAEPRFAGEWITHSVRECVHDVYERRLPTRAELRRAVPDRPVLIYQTALGPQSPTQRAWPGHQGFDAREIAKTGALHPEKIDNALYLLRLTQTRDQRQTDDPGSMGLLSQCRLTAHIDQEAFLRLRQALDTSWATRSLRPHASIPCRHSIISTHFRTGTRVGLHPR